MGPAVERTLNRAVLTDDDLRSLGEALPRTSDLTRSDIYSLGVLLYELLTGRTPFDTQKLLAAGYDAVMRTIREEEPPKPSTRLSTLGEVELNTVATKRGSDPAKLNRLVRGDLDWIVMKALEKDRTRRYETVNGFAADLQRHLGDEPVLAGPPTARYRVKKFVRKHRRVVVVTAGFVALLLLASVVSTGLALWANRERGNARRSEADAKKARAETEQEARRRLDALTEMQIQRAEELFSADDSARAVAYLASVLAVNRSNRVAAERLLSALTLRSFGLPLTEPLSHEGAVNIAQFSPDGARVLTASLDRTARVWNAKTGKPLTEALRHEDLVFSAQFSPDTLRVVTASSDNTARVWDAQTGKPLIEPLRHEDWVTSAQFSRDGAWVLTASSDGTARVWDAQTGKPLTKPLLHEGAVNVAQFSPDGLRVLTASHDKTAQVWDSQTGKPVGVALRHAGPVRWAEFSPDGLRVLTGSHDKTARVWDAQTGKPLTEPLQHESMIHSAQFSPDGARLLTTWAGGPNGRLGYARVWDAQTGRPLTEPLEHTSRVLSAQFSPDGAQVLTTWFQIPNYRPGYAQVWDAQTGRPLTEPLKHERACSAQFSPDGLRVITASYDKTARLWDAQTGKPLTEPLRHEKPAWFAQSGSAQFSPDGARVLTVSSDNKVRLWEAQPGKALAVPLRHEGSVRSARFSGDGLRVVTASEDRTARVWDAQTGKPLTEPLRHEDSVSSAEFSPDGLRVITASMDSTARLWDAQTGKPLAEPLRHEGLVSSAQFSPDGLRVVTASADKTARVWEMTLSSVPVPAWLPQLAAAVAGKRLTGSEVLEPVAAKEWLNLKQQLSTAPATNFYNCWAKWFCADRATRTISPASSITMPEYVQRQIQENTLESLREAVRLSPNNGLALARLAAQVLAQSEKDNPRQVREADFFSRRATELSPNDPEVRRVRSEILLNIKEAANPGTKATDTSPPARKPGP
jgi:WD40 repeat protein